MKIVFMGTPEFAVPSLEALIQKGYKVVAVVTSPDKPAGRGLKLNFSAVKKFAVEKGIKVLQPLNLKDPEFLKELKTLSPDLQIVVAFRMLPEQVWNLPPLGTYNLHASLLPKYRGAAPINRAIMAGERETGLTTFRLQQEMDSGNILLQKKVSIGENTTAGELHDIMMHEGAELLIDSVVKIENSWRSGKELDLKTQDLNSVSHAPKIHRETCRINWQASATEIHNHIRGLSPYPGAFTSYEDDQKKPVQFKLFRSQPISDPHDKPNGFLIDVSKSALTVACGEGSLKISELQMEGKRRMQVEEFIRGFRFRDGAVFG